MISVFRVLYVALDHIFYCFPPLPPHRYYYLAFRAHQMPETSKDNAVAILERAKLEGWVLGTTKVASLYHQKGKQ